MRNKKTCGVIEENKAFGTMRIASPKGVIAAITPTTNPTSTTIYKMLLALKTRNAIILSPHPDVYKRQAYAVPRPLHAIRVAFLRPN